MKEDIYISEVFISIQGEGWNCGKLSLFLRTSGCPLNCIWCDTEYAKQQKAEHRKNIGEIIQKLKDMNLEYGIKNLVITGGEPLIQMPQIEKIIEYTSTLFHTIEIETSGIIKPSQYLLNHSSVYFNFSPKLKNSGNSEDIIKVLENNIKSIKEYFFKSIFKFVVCDLKDIEEINRFVEEVGVERYRVWLMPCTKGNRSLGEEIEWWKNVAELSLSYNYNFSPRLQIILGLK